jgi:hypothetical protein
MQDRYRRIVKIFLLRTAGPYMWVKTGNGPIEQKIAGYLPKPDICASSTATPPARSAEAERTRRALTNTRGQPPAGLGLRQTRSNGSRQAWGATS